MSNEQKRRKLGEYLLEERALTPVQLDKALQKQEETGGQIGSKLVELNLIEAKTLVKALSKQLGHPVANLLELRLDPKALKLLSTDQLKKYQVLPVAFYDKQVVLAVMTPGQKPAVDELPHILGRPIKTIVVPAYQLLMAIKELASREIPETKFRLQASAAPKYPGIWELCRRLSKSNASDLLLVAGTYPALKENHELVRFDTPMLTPEQMEIYANDLMTRRQKEEFAEQRDIDFALTDHRLGRFRVNIYRQRTSISIAIRHIIEDIPTFDQLNLPNWLENYALKAQGLILISGPNGHGKSTTMAAMIDVINSKSKRNIITIEDPIEYLHQHKSSNVNQREIGIDTSSFNEGLRHIYREAPDVIMIGEMRDRESIAIALEAADTGHLVISSLHANNSVMAINRIVDVFKSEQQQQIRVQLADNLLLSFHQRLLKARNSDARIPAFEKLANSHRVANLIREGKDHQIRNLLVNAEEFVSLDSNLAHLVAERKVEREMARHVCLDQKQFLDMLK
ncbi:pilus retraction protein PilT [Malonomonas rubra DSM 5091]|uniref:Pilus retraction protein PilT n=1 Tax=Malonomonas rubra DSM 5091 TaxID=1122189 RepID=A0A1M6IIC4_MALRU|nr:PilT/PilU family type 4a pilus ATPase [Malonomonas rubra]SHJ34222.1 pilus retraction protein PilT [Malonomonas rubra DSM 5091]